MSSLSKLRVKIFADGADRIGMLEMYQNPLISGFTTNPTLMRKAGVTDYPTFARDIVRAIPDRPISFEVLCDDLNEMERQARVIAQWGENVYVKIPVTNTLGESSVPVVRSLTRAGINVNVTALLALDQVREVSAALAGGAPAFVSVFAGRVADTGRDPVPLMQDDAFLQRPDEEWPLLLHHQRKFLRCVDQKLESRPHVVESGKVLEPLEERPNGISHDDEVEVAENRHPRKRPSRL